MRSFSYNTMTYGLEEGEHLLRSPWPRRSSIEKRRGDFFERRVRKAERWKREDVVKGDDVSSELGGERRSRERKGRRKKGVGPEGDPSAEGGRCRLHV
jgi:hypothetical protein